jgi:hypothetical protein
MEKIKCYNALVSRITQCLLIATSITIGACSGSSNNDIEVPVEAIVEPPPQPSVPPSFFPVQDTILGTQAFTANYTFDPTTTELVEQANIVHDSGFKAFKFGLSERIFSDWETQTGDNSFYDLPNRNNYSSLADIAANEPSVRAVLDMDFKITSMWVYEHGESEQFIDTSSAYEDIYQLTKDLLTRYNNSGKVFLLGHWEGDWAVIGNFDPNVSQLPATRKENYINWINNRQAAIEAARADTPHDNVWVGHYVELNQVSDFVDDNRERLVNGVLPNVLVDAVSYSAYDAGLDNIERNLSTIETYANTTNYLDTVFADKKIFIGEFGFAMRDLQGIQIRNADEQRDLSMSVLTSARQWGVPLAYYWQLYNNETTSNGLETGFWLIDDQNNRQPVFDTFIQYIEDFN